MVQAKDTENVTPVLVDVINMVYVDVNDRHTVSAILPLRSLLLSDSDVTEPSGPSSLRDPSTEAAPLHK